MWYILAAFFGVLGLNSFHNFEKGTINQQYKSAKLHPCTAKEDFWIPSPQPAQGSVIHTYSWRLKKVSE